jgi:hypothetical protein
MVNGRMMAASSRGIRYSNATRRKSVLKVSKLKVDTAAFRKIVFDGINCKDPHKTPQWAHDIWDNVVNTDRVEILITREFPDEPAKPVTDDDHGTFVVKL